MLSLSTALLQLKWVAVDFLLYSFLSVALLFPRYRPPPFPGQIIRYNGRAIVLQDTAIFRGD